MTTFAREDTILAARSVCSRARWCGHSRICYDLVDLLLCRLTKRLVSRLSLSLSRDRLVSEHESNDVLMMTSRVCVSMTLPKYVSSHTRRYRHLKEKTRCTRLLFFECPWHNEHQFFAVHLQEQQSSYASAGLSCWLERVLQGESNKKRLSLTSSEHFP